MIRMRLARMLWRHILPHLLLIGALRRLEPARVDAASRLDCVCACTMEAPNFCHAANALACGRAPICAIWFLSRGGPSENSSHHICAISLTDIHSCFSQRLMIIYVRPLLVDCKLEIACCLPPRRWRCRCPADAGPASITENMHHPRTSAGGSLR